VASNIGAEGGRFILTCGRLYARAEERCHAGRARAVGPCDAFGKEVPGRSPFQLYGDAAKAKGNNQDGTRSASPLSDGRPDDSQASEGPVKLYQYLAALMAADGDLRVCSITTTVGLAIAAHEPARSAVVVSVRHGQHHQVQGFLDALP